MNTQRLKINFKFMEKYRKVPMAAPETKEVETITETQVRLYFMRHDDKEQTASGQSDTTVELTPKGRAAVIKKSQEQPGHPEVAWAGGSSRVRAAHTALLRMGGATGRFTPEMNFAEAKAEAEKELKYGKKAVHLPELNFFWEGTPEFNKKAMDSYKAGHGLEFLLHESDDLAAQLKDKESLSYSRVAANYASLIAKEMRVGHNFNQIVAREPSKYAQYGNQLERYFGTHQTVSECFYMKVLEKLHGRAKAEEFIEKLRNEKGQANGFDFQEGFEVKIKNGLDGQSVILSSVRGLPEIELTPQLLIDIIGDATKLDEEIKKKQ